MAIVRQHHLRDGARRPAELVPGELVWASIVNGIENPLARGKSRPVILIRPDGWAWQTIGLTTRPRHRDGKSRCAIPDARAVGLKQPGWLWSGSLGPPAGIDIGDHIGWLDQSLVFEVANLAGLDGPTIKTLLLAALTHHAPSA